MQKEKGKKIKKRTATITIRLEEKDKQKILQYAYDKNMSITEILEDAFHMMVDNDNIKNYESMDENERM